MLVIAWVLPCALISVILSIDYIYAYPTVRKTGLVASAICRISHSNAPSVRCEPRMGHKPSANHFGQSMSKLYQTQCDLVHPWLVSVPDSFLTCSVSIQRALVFDDTSARISA